MYDEGYRRRENLHRGRSGRETKSKRGALGLTGFQTIICVLVLLAALLIRQFGGSFYITAKNSVSGVLNAKISQGQISQVFKTIQSRLPDAKTVFGINSGSSSKNSSSAAAASSGTTSQPSASKGTSSTSEKTSFSPSGITYTEAVVKNNSCLTGEGGEDLSVSSDGDSLTAPTNTMLGPYLLSANLQWPVEGGITSGFGYRINPITKKLSFHTGIDIASPEGTPIKAALPGTVEETGTNNAYGNYVLLSHGGGVESFYGHCEKVTATKGMPVKTGDVIATVGTTGMSTGYHLHFEIRINHITVNPTWTLTQRM